MINFPFIDRTKRRKDSLTKTLWIVIFFLCIICVTAFLAATVMETGRTERREAELTLVHMSDSINSEISTYSDISRLIMIQSDVVRYLRKETNDPLLKIEARYGIMGMLNSCRYIDSVFIFRNDGNYVSTGHGSYLVSDILSHYNSWPQEITDKRGGAVVQINGGGLIQRFDGKPVLTIARSVYDIDSQQQTGLLFMNISADMLSYVVRQQPDKTVGIFTSEGAYISGDEQLAGKIMPEFSSSSIQSRFIPDEDRRLSLISGVSLGSIPLTLIYSSGLSTTRIPSDIVIALVVALLAFLVSALILGAFITRKITNPVNALAKGIEENKLTDRLHPISANMPDNEIGELASSYNSMVEHHNQLVEKQIESESNMQKEHLRVLQEQIKPHFLYNSLETISCLAIDEGAEKVRNALEVLGNFYRNFLSSGAKVIPLSREISIIQNYISMQKLRYADMITDEYDIAPDTLECMVPKLLLQPLVENSINHGARMKGENVLIKITTFLKDDDLHIIVYDSGIGMPKEKADELQKLFTEPAETGTTENLAESTRGGFGLRGTIHRIRYFSDREDAFTIRSEEGEYTEIEIILPASIPQEGEEDNVQSHGNR